MELHQSPLYATFIRRLKWKVVTVRGTRIFIRGFPIVGALAKIQRITELPPIESLLPIFQEHHVRTVAIEPSHTVDANNLARWCAELRHYVRITTSPYLPTKTIIINLDDHPPDNFRRLSEAKRRAVRKAVKNGVVVGQYPEINSFITLKNRSVGPFGFITTTGLRELWQTLAPQHAAILLASLVKEKTNEKFLAGVLLIFWNKTAYYWMAASTKIGKKIFAPTLLVWEALKFARVRGCRSFDFVGVWDERIPRQNKEWLGFTKFKEGFGGQALYYPFVPS
jgi:lipid II:glycine glycyltransferase (peptidoglycan interpeptide bridge formation enzyme)